MRIVCKPNSCRRFRTGRKIRTDWLLALLILVLSLSACGSDDGGDGPPDATRTTSRWDRYAVAEVAENGTTIPWVKAKYDEVSGSVHLAYFSGAVIQGATSAEDIYHQQLRYAVWNLGATNIGSTIIDNRPSYSGYDTPPNGLNFDRTSQFGMDMDPTTGEPVLIYPVDEFHPLPYSQIEGDIMINILTDYGWMEYIGAYGYVERNPAYRDGDLRANMSVAVDHLGDIHMCYQFYTEGMDRNNEIYPDLFYATRERATLADSRELADFMAIEENVDGNSYSTFGIMNSVGYYCQMLLAPVDEEADPVPPPQPIIVYAQRRDSYGGDNNALKIAYRNGADNWRVEVLDQLSGDQQVNGISAAFYPDGSLGIAYAIKVPYPEPDNGHRLKYISNQTGEWVIDLIDEATWCGAHPSLAIDAEGNPSVAYYDERSHSYRPHHFLKFAHYAVNRWVHESIDEYNEIGLYNTLWLDLEGRANICSYSDEENAIFIYRQRPEG